MDLQSGLQAFLDANPDLPDHNTDADASQSAPAVKSQRLNIVYERKGRGGKQATIITGFSGSDDELLALASTLKRRLATGGSARGGEILIQGDRRDDLRRILTELGYRTRVL